MKYERSFKLDGQFSGLYYIQTRVDKETTGP